MVLIVLSCLGWLLRPALASEPASQPPTLSPASPTLLLVLGAHGEPEFGTNFVRQADGWTRAAAQAGVPVRTIGLDDPAPKTDLEVLRDELAAQIPVKDTPLWLVLVGHGTFDNKEARFNLRGPDFTATELSGWLKPFERPLVIINTAASSGPFLAKLSATNRVVITATRSGSEQNFTRLGEHLAVTIADPTGDLDKDGQVSVLEAFLTAAARVAEFYKTEGRLATEHPLIDDNGDGLGTPADWFRGVRAVKKSQQAAAVDGFRAQQISLVLSPDEQALPPDVRARRDAMELELFRLRDLKASLAEEDYYRRLEALLLELARLQTPEAD